MIAHTLTHSKIRSKRRRRLLQLVRLVSPSLRVGPAPFARGSRHVRPGRGQSASSRRRSVAASASPPLPPHSVATRHLAVAAQASPPLQPRAVVARHRAVAASASPPRPPHAVAASPQLRFLLLSSTTRAQTRPGRSSCLSDNEPSRPESRLSTLPVAADSNRHPHYSAPAGAMPASASPAPCALHQLRLSWRPTCPPLTCTGATDTDGNACELSDDAGASCHPASQTEAPTASTRRRSRRSPRSASASPAWLQTWSATIGPGATCAILATVRPSIA